MKGGNSIGLRNHGGGKFNWPPKSWRGEIQLAFNNNEGGNFTVPHSTLKIYQLLNLTKEEKQ
jgi:hypothetical protein